MGLLKSLASYWLCDFSKLLTVLVPVSLENGANTASASNGYVRIKQDNV